MKKRIVIASILGLILALAMGVPAMAISSHPPGSHHHHIHLPNGTCLEITSKHSGFKHADDSNARVQHHHSLLGPPWGHLCPD